MNPLYDWLLLVEGHPNRWRLGSVLARIELRWQPNAHGSPVRRTDQATNDSALTNHAALPSGGEAGIRSLCAY
jgi:hypothetical protein